MSPTHFEPNTVSPMQATSFNSLLAVAGLGIAIFVASSGRSDGATVVQTYSSTPGAVVPDNNLSGLVDTIDVSTAMTSVDKVTVTIETTGGWAGDIYAYLHYDGVTSILLNRPARTLAAPAGSSASSMTITLDDSAVSDIHGVTVGADPITGTFQPDGRNVDPLTVTDASPRTTNLGDFIGADPTGVWSLFIADVSAGDEATLVSWSISLTGDVVPEPSIAILGALGLLLSFRRRR